MPDKYGMDVATPERIERRQPGALEIIGLLWVICTMVGLLVGMLLETPWAGLWRWPVYGALTPLVVVILACFLYLGIRTYNAGMWAIERRAGRDMDGDGAVGNPHLVMVNPRLGQEEARRQTAEELRADYERFIRGCQVNTSMGYWLDRSMTRDQYRKFRDGLLDGGYAAWNSNEDKRQDWRLLLPAEQVIAEMWRA